MYRLSLIISEIYNKYLPLAEKDGVILNLDFSDTTKEIADPERVKQYLDKHLDSTLKRSDRGEVTISVDKGAIVITDSATTLSRAACALLSNRYIEASSRVGFGTTIKIFLQPRSDISTNPASPEEKPHVESAGFAVSIDKTAPNPVLESKVALTGKQKQKKFSLGAKLRLRGKKKSQSNTKTTKPETSKKTSSLKSTLAKQKSKRQIAAAARKADKEVKRIAKKASKQAKKISKKTEKQSIKKKTTKTPAKTTAKKSTKKLIVS